MSLLKKTIPNNLIEEKAKFLADDAYDPVFTYEDPVPEEELYTYGKAQQKYIDLAKEVLDRAYFGRNEADLLMMQGKLIGHDEVNARLNSFLEMHNLQDHFSVVWSSSFVSRASIDGHTIKLRQNAEFREDGLIGLIYHEVGTHAIRRINYEKQYWYKKKKKYGLTADYLRTEEGLASLHTLLAQKNKSAYSSAIRYLASNYAQSHSLRETWNFLGKYLQDPETRWMVSFRQKRGIGDTRKPGGFTKDLVYFEGLLQTCHWLKHNDYALEKVYLGKIACEDAHKAFELSPTFKPLLPSFYTTNKDAYKKNVDDVYKDNLFDTFFDSHLV